MRQSGLSGIPFRLFPADGLISSYREQRDNAHPDGSRLHLRRRQEHAGRRAVPHSQATRHPRGAVQAAEHGAQFRRHRRRWRDRPRAGAAGAGGRPRTAYRLQPGVAQAEYRQAGAGHHPRQGAAGFRRGGLSRVQAAGDEGGARILRAAVRAIRMRGRRRRRQPGRDQPARPRHRQHGLRRSRRLPGDPDRRHRPRRCLRPSRRHAGPALALGTGAGEGLRHQPFSRRHQVARIGAGLAGRAHRQAGDRRAALPARAVSGCRGCAAARAPRRRGRPS